MSNSTQSPKNPIVLLLTVVLLSFGGYLILPAIIMPLGASLVGLSMQQLMLEWTMPDPILKYQLVLILIQGVSAISSFILIPLWFVKKYEKGKASDYFNTISLNSTAVVIVAGLTLSVMVVNGFFIEWNMNVEFPASIADKIDAMEAQGKLLTDYLIHFDSFGYFLLIIFTVALAPAVGEELLFRGLIQKYAGQLLKNPHLAIWGTAILFSAFHLQFYGFVPRMLLGAFFGYLLYFSGNLSYAIIGHFINNGFTVTLVYLHQVGLISYDIEGDESVPLLSVAIFSIIGIILFALFRKQFHITENLQNE